MKGKKLTVIFPAYGEKREAIEDGAGRVREMAHRWGFETLAVVAQNGDRHKFKFDKPWIKTYFQRQRGFGSAIREAVKLVEDGYGYIISPDLPFGLSDLRQMLELRSEYELIIGSKLHPQSTYVISPKRKLGTLGLSYLLKLMVPGLPVRDPNGSIWFDAQATKPIWAKLVSKDYFVSLELIYRAYRAKVRIGEVPVTYVKFNTASSVKLTADGWKYLAQLVRITAGK